MSVAPPVQVHGSSQSPSSLPADTTRGFEVPREPYICVSNPFQIFKLYPFTETSCLQYPHPGHHTAPPPRLHAVGGQVSSVPATPLEPTVNTYCTYTVNTLQP